MEQHTFKTTIKERKKNKERKKKIKRKKESK
jgi:hypothetical protein